MKLISGGVFDHQIGTAQFDEVFIELFFGIDVLTFVFFAAGHFKERRAGDVDVTRFDQRTHLAEEVGQKQRTDVGTVHVSICHDDHTVVTCFAHIEILTDAASDSVDEGLDLFVIENTVDACFFHVQQFTADGQNCLECRVAP